VQGPILAFIYAVKEMLEEGQGTDASLPVNVAFVFEGEEENGTPSLPQQPLLGSLQHTCAIVMPDLFSAICCLCSQLECIAAMLNTYFGLA